MVYFVYYDGDRIDLFITRGIVDQDDEQVEFGQVFFKGTLDLNNIRWTGFSGGEDFFIYMPENGYYPNRAEIYNNISGMFEKHLKDIINNMPPDNYRESVVALMSI